MPGDREPDAMLRTFLADHDQPCPACGYNLRGLTRDRCPECNQALILQVGLAERHLGALIAAVLGFGVGGGAAGIIFIGVVVVSAWKRRMPRMPEEFLMLVAAPLLVCAIFSLPTMLLISRPGRSWFHRRSAAQRRAVVAGAWMSTAGVVTLWLAAMLA